MSRAQEYRVEYDRTIRRIAAPQLLPKSDMRNTSVRGFFVRFILHRGLLQYIARRAARTLSHSFKSKLGVENEMLIYNNMRYIYNTTDVCYGGTAFKFGGQTAKRSSTGSISVD